MASNIITGVRFECFGKAEARSKIKGYLDKKEGARVFTPNSLILYKASRDERLRRLINNGDLLLPDGIGVSLICRLRGHKGCERITGIDTAEWMLRYAARTGLSVYLLGGERTVAERAAADLKKKLPDLKIAGTHHGYFDKKVTSKENAEVLKKIRRSRADIVFVCMGFPTQEAWIYRYARQLPDVRLFMGLGGSLDVWSGKTRRAPLFFRAAGLEWLWRTLCEPRRAFELLSIPLFLIKEK